MRLIDVDALIKELSTMYKSPTSTEDFMTVGYDKAIADVVVTTHRQPSAYVPDRKVGEWVVIMDEPTITFDECKCSECGVVEYFNKGWKKFNYCPNCGARMKGETSDLGRDKDDSRDY